MRPARPLLAGTGLLLALLLAGVWLLPGMLDWNRYRGSIAGLVAAGIGRPVRIDGNVTLNLLPQPILTASGLVVEDSGGAVLLSAKELRLRVALGPLLAGQVNARELTLRGADLRLPWPPPPGALTRRPPPWITGLQARVEGSRLEVGSLVLEGIDASLAADPDTGTLSTAGTATMLGGAWQFTARLARPGGDGAAALDVSLDGQGNLRNTGGTFSGALAADGALSGRVAGRGPDLSQLMPAPPIAWRGDGRLSAAGGVAIADELALEIGGSPATGAVALRVQPEARLDVALATGRLDLDAWMPVLLHAAQPGMQPKLPTGIDLSSEAASLGGGTVRRLRGAFDLEPDGVVVRDASALLPGDAPLTLSGRLPAHGSTFEGTAHLQAPDLRTTLRWLQPLSPAVVGALPPDTLRTADLSAKVAIDPLLASLSDLHGTLDGNALQGGLSLRMAPRPGVSAGLALDRLALDPWLPDPATLRYPAAAYTALIQSLAHAGFDADVKLQVQAAAWRGTALGALSIDAQSEAGRLTLRRLEANPLGVRMTASGTIGEGGRVSEGRLDASTQLLEAARAILPWDAPGLLRGPASLLVQVSGPPEALAVRATLDLDELRVETQPVVNLGARHWAGPVSLHYPGASRFLDMVGVPGAAWLGEGSLSLIAQAAADPGRLQLNDLELVAGAMRAGGRLAWAGGAFSGRVVAETLPLPPLPPRSSAPIDVGALRQVQADLHVEAGQVLVGLEPALQDLAADLSLQAGVLRLDHVAAKLGGGDVGATVRLDANGMPAASIQAAMTNVTLAGPLLGGSLDLQSGQVDAQFDLQGQGYSPAAMLATLSGTATLRVRDGVATGFDLAAAASGVARPDADGIPGAIRSALTAGSTPFTRLEMPITCAAGVLTLDGQLTAPSGTAKLTGSVELPSATLTGRLVLRPPEGAPELATRLSGPATAPVRTPELAGLARWLAERS